MKIGLLALLFLLAFQSCKKDELTYQIEGTVSDKYSKTAIANVEINLYQKIYINNVLNDNFKLVGSTTTDLDGNYSFEIPRDRIYEIRLELIHNQHYEKTSIYSSSKITTANVNIFDEKLESRSWVRIIIKNPYIEPEEQLNIYKINFREGCEDCCGNGGQSFIEVGDTTFKCPTVGGQEVTLNYGKVGNQVQFTENFISEPFDTTEIYIQY